MAAGYQIIRVVQEIGAGINDERPQLHTLLAQYDCTKRSPLSLTLLLS